MSIKKLLSLVLCLIMLVSLGTTLTACSSGGGNINAKEGEAANGFLWENNYSEITITGYEGASNKLKVPATINKKPITKIKSGAFSGFKALESVDIPETIKDISGAFSKCTGLKKVTLNKGVENISSAFSGCTSLESISVPNSVTSASSAFSGCTALVSAEFTGSIETLSSTFSDCTSLKTVKLPDGIENLSSTFSGCTSLETVEIPKSVKGLNSAFADCTSLKSIALPDGIENISSAFKGCTSLSSVKIPDSVTEFSDAFRGCTSLTELHIPSAYIKNIKDTAEKEYKENTKDLPEEDIKHLQTPEQSIRYNIPYRIEELLSGCPSIKTLTVADEYLYYLFYPASKSSSRVYQKQDGDAWYDSLISKVAGNSSYTYSNQVGTAIGSETYCRIYADYEDHIVENTEVDGKLTVTIEKNYWIGAPESGWSIDTKRIAIIETITRTENAFIVSENYSSDSITINGDSYKVSKPDND